VVTGTTHLLFCISCGNVDLKIGWIADFCLFAG
jgi:hypothetical protein